MEEEYSHSPYSCQNQLSSIPRIYGSFREKYVRESAFIEYHYGSLVYGNLRGRQRQHYAYSESIMGLTGEEFEKRAFQMDRPCMLLEGKENNFMGEPGKNFGQGYSRMIQDTSLVTNKNPNIQVRQRKNGEREVRNIWGYCNSSAIFSVQSPGHYFQNEHQ